MTMEGVQIDPLMDCQYLSKEDVSRPIRVHRRADEVFGWERLNILGFSILVG